MKNRKKRFWLFGCAIVFALTAFSFSTALAEFSPPTSWSYANVYHLGLPRGTIGTIINMLTTWLVGMFAFFGIIGFVVSGIMYLISTGNDEMITKAKKYMTYSLVGVVVGLAGYVVLQAAHLMLSASSSF